MPSYQARSPFAVTLDVWRALFLREAVARMFGKRAALAWLLLEPITHLAFIVLIFAVLRVRHVGGLDTALWLLSGLLAFFLFRRVATQGASAIDANLALFTYRQVRPVDTVLVRCALEGVVMLLVSALVLAGAAILGVPVHADDPLTVWAAVVGLWLLGVGYALCVSVLGALMPEVANVVGMLLMPLYFLSGVMVPMSAIPYPYREWMMYNPIIHGVEGVRTGIAEYYHAGPEQDLSYLFAWVLVTLFLGLALQVRHRRRLASL